ncbi:2-phospho-L-lactate guanylyltransferase [soil metagenome]
MQWTIIIPVKGGASAKSRLLPADLALARAIALDTIAAAVGASLVSRVIVPTSDAEMVDAVTDLGAHPLLESAPRGIAAAIDLALADVSGDRAVLLGDLPALRPEDLDAALALAAAHPATFVADDEGTGTTLVTARGGVPFVSAFGEGSAQAHRELGLVELPVAAASRLRHDVDTAAQLAAAEQLGLGAFSRAVRADPASAV